MKKILTKLSFLLFFPVLVSAQGNLNGLIQVVDDILSSLIPLVVALALLYFFYGLAKFIWEAGKGGAGQEEAKSIMFWGIIALFVMLSVWGIVELLANTIFGNTVSPDFPIQIEQLLPK